MPTLDSNLKVLKRIDKRDYLTSREHREFGNQLVNELHRLDKMDRVIELLKKYNEVEPFRYMMKDYLNGNCSYESFMTYSTRILEDDPEDLPTEEEFELLRSIFR